MIALLLLAAAGIYYYLRKKRLCVRKKNLPECTEGASLSPSSSSAAAAAVAAAPVTHTPSLSSVTNPLTSTDGQQQFNSLDRKLTKVVSVVQSTLEVAKENLEVSKQTNTTTDALGKYAYSNNISSTIYEYFLFTTYSDGQHQEAKQRIVSWTYITVSSA